VGLFTGLLTLPLAPVRGVAWLGEQLQNEALRQLNDPARIHTELAEIDAAFEAGQLTEEERDERQDELVARLLEGGGGR
jgi:Gas vesicle protein G